MKKIITLLALFTGAQLFAQDYSQYAPDRVPVGNGGIYLRGDAGIAQEDHVKFNGVNVTFGTGARFDLAVGTDFGDFSGEISAGIAYSPVNSIGGIHNGETKDGITLNGSIDHYQVPILWNLIYNIPLKGKFRPFIGAGIGGVYHVASYNGDVTFNSNAISVRGSGSGSENDFTFGYQVMAGLKYMLNDKMEIGLIYKGLGTPGPEFSFRNTGYKIKGENTLTHSLQLAFQYTF